MEADFAVLRSDIAALRLDVTGIRQDIGVLEAKAEAVETWRNRYMTQEEQVTAKLFAKVDELVAGLGDMRVELSRIRGERDAERRMTLTVISLLSAICGGLATNFFRIGGP